MTEGFDFSTGVEYRPEMEWWESYPRLDKSTCSFCHSGQKRTDLLVTKHHHPFMPLGIVFTRCPDIHQPYWEARRADAIAQWKAANEH